jgi:hypothetical protein
MRTFVLIAIVIGHLLFAGSLYLIFGVGRKLAPEIITAEFMVYPLVMGVVGIWIWFAFWSTGKILKTKSTPPAG